MAQATLAGLGRAEAQQDPARNALIDAAGALSYAELDRRANQVAAALVAAGVQPADRIAILADSSAQFYEICIGAARAGVVPVPINARLSLTEVAAIIADCDARCLFFDARFAPIATALQADHGFACVIETGAALAAWRAPHAPVDPGGGGDADAVCVQLYTSGTSGVAKGVQLTNRNLFAFGAAGAADADSPWDAVTGDTVSLVTLPHGHIAGLGLVLLGLARGACHILLREFSPAEVGRALDVHRPDFILVVPAMIPLLLALEAETPGRTACLRALTYAGAPIPAELLARTIAELPHLRLTQLYGLTETSGPITWLRPEDHRDPTLLGSCGRPVPGAELIVADSRGDPCADGVVGEFWCRSAQVMRGYWRRDDENAAVLTNGWFRTGDVGLRDARGYFFIVDRKRDMIISGGENIYPGEIERVLRDHPAIADAAVFGVPDARWGEAVRAAIVTRPGASITFDGLIDFLRPRLAGFKLPKAIDIVADLPRNPTGKILRRQLREPFWRGMERRVS
ncbi:MULTISPECIES: class I adenylate-forming enzyme family protein [unclassified Sphingomonas]|jgi:acyl-CoA synthetase (AMP-forming)/AMP-acid ligase II|uniref:class I adenylate-forming enzyme family protein n=1 Tax=unclassified Sphingomonas TaxID=196159 RepID=UPI0009ECB80E|nr:MULTISPECIES: AMP-binding protein [unclassified Sphingomonas]